MICISALCVVLALSSIAASPIPQDRIEQLMEEISSSVVGELIIVAKHATATNMDTQEFNKELLTTTHKAFKRMDPQIKELLSLSDKSPVQLAKDLTRRINENQAFKDALPKSGELSPRFAGVVGTIGNIAYEIIEAATHIFIGPTVDCSEC